MLLPQATGPYRVIKSRGHTVTIEREGLQDTISIDQESSAHHPSKLPTTFHHSLRRPYA